MTYPVVVDAETGVVLQRRVEEYIEGFPKGTSQPFGVASLKPLGWSAGKPDGSRMVGWTLTPKGKSQIVAAHAFTINPQSIVWTPTPRNQLFATQSSFYVDDFGPGSASIQITQLVASGRPATPGGPPTTMRADVLKFYDDIYDQAVSNPGQYDVYFYDNHLFSDTKGATPELVYFPGQAFQLTRAVSLHNVWQLSLSMGTLPQALTAAKASPPVAGQPQVRVHVVQAGETLKSIAAKLAGKNGTHQRVLQLEQQIEALTKKYGADDITKQRDVPIFDSQGQQTGSMHVSRLHLAVGEKIILPAG